MATKNPGGLSKVWGGAAVPVGPKNAGAKRCEGTSRDKGLFYMSLEVITGGSAELVFGLLGKTPAAVPNCGPGRLPPWRLDRDVAWFE